MSSPHNHTAEIVCIDAHVSLVLFSSFCTLAFMYSVLAFFSFGCLLLLFVWSGVRAVWNKHLSLSFHLLVLCLACVSRVIKTLFNNCIIKYDIIWYPISWSITYAFEAVTLGMFVVHWYSTLGLTRHGFKKEAAVRQGRLLFLFTLLGVVLSTLSAISLHFLSPLSGIWIIINTFSSFMSMCIALLFLRVSFLLKKQVEKMLMPSLSYSSSSSASAQQRLNLDFRFRSEAIKEITQALQNMWFAGRVVMLCYFFTPFIPLSHYLFPSSTPERTQLAIMGIAYGGCVLVALSVMHIVILPSVSRANKQRVREEHEEGGEGEEGKIPFQEWREAEEDEGRRGEREMTEPMSPRGSLASINQLDIYE